MLSLNLKRIIKTGFINFWRNGTVSLSAVLVMIVALFVLATVMFTGALLNHTLTEIKDKVDVNVTVVRGVDENEVLKLKKSIESLPEVDAVEYLTPDQVLNDYKEENKDNEKNLAFLDEIGSNPFGAILNVRAKEPSRYESVQKFLEQNYGDGTLVEKINYARKKDVIDRLTNIISAGEKLGAFLTILFVVISILITLVTIRLAMYMSRDEIHVMKLVGASSSYISGPFVVTGAMYGLISSAVVLIALYPITYWLGESTNDFFFGLNVFKYYLQNFGQFFLVMMVAGVFVGSVSSALAVNRYLKNNPK